jgi:hypothetical protein
LNRFLLTHKPLIAISLFILISVLSHCDQKEKISKSPRIRKISKVIAPKYDESINISDTIKFNVKSIHDTVAIDSFLVFDNKKINFNSNRTYDIATATQTGLKNLRISVFFSNGKKESHNHKITL